MRSWKSHFILSYSRVLNIALGDHLIYILICSESSNTSSYYKNSVLESVQDDLDPLRNYIEICLMNQIRYS